MNAIVSSAELFKVHRFDTLPAAAERDLIALCCFGRGGSNIVWSAIASSPDVISMADEWHRAVYGHIPFAGDHLRRLVRYVQRRHVCTRRDTGKEAASSAITRGIARFMMSSLRMRDVEDKPEAKAIVAKVMDYSLFNVDLIGREFRSTRLVVLTRHPLGQCESLMRSGASLENAIIKYCEVGTAMAKLADRDGHLVHFEELANDPNKTYEDLFGFLDVSRPDAYWMKRKKFGDARDKNTDVGRSDYHLIPARKLPEVIDKTAFEKSAARLSPAQSERIMAQCGSTAEQLGY